MGMPACCGILASATPLTSGTASPHSIRSGALKILNKSRSHQLPVHWCRTAHQASAGYIPRIRGGKQGFSYRGGSFRYTLTQVVLRPQATTGSFLVAKSTTNLLEITHLLMHRPFKPSEVRHANCVLQDTCLCAEMPQTSFIWHVQWRLSSFWSSWPSRLGKLRPCQLSWRRKWPWHQHVNLNRCKYRQQTGPRCMVCKPCGR